MTTARHHYMADWFYPDPAVPGGSLKVSDRIVAHDDAEAIREAAPLRDNPVYWRVRRVTRTSERVIYDSRREAPDA